TIARTAAISHRGGETAVGFTVPLPSTMQNISNSANTVSTLRGELTVNSRGNGPRIARARMIAPLAPIRSRSGVIGINVILAGRVRLFPVQPLHDLVRRARIAYKQDQRKQADHDREPGIGKLVEQPVNEIGRASCRERE